MLPNGFFVWGRQSRWYTEAVIMQRMRKRALPQTFGGGGGGGATITIALKGRIGGVESRSSRNDTPNKEGK